MSHAISRRASSRARRAIVIPVAVSLAASLAVPANTASAQLGGLVKKARDKVVEKQVDKQIEKRTGTSSTSASEPPAFDNVTLELTTERVEGVIRGLTAGRAILDGTNGGASRATLAARRDEAATRRGELSDKNAKLLNAYTEKHDETQRCRHNAMYASAEKRRQAEQQRMQEHQAKALSDPAYREKVLAISQKMAVAQQKGDTAELRRLGAQLGLTERDTKPDSIAADKACGPMPTPPAVLVQMDQLDAQANTLTEQIRELEEKAAATEVKESGMNERQFHMARERIEAYLSAMKYKTNPGAFSAGELEALGARRADLEKVM
ncbi:MAG TPA: hypothetical protein VFZ21_13300 [Gemmatimonadaceae bacterium]|jgi:hypothetical protein|nr:hypothetical protein [Gemmatimonadaceae bacterium]